MWAEATNTATLMSNVIPNDGNDNKMCPDEEFYGFTPNIYGNLQPFGRVGYVTKVGTGGKKFDRKTDKCVMMGYAANHSRDTN